MPIQQNEVQLTGVFGGDVTHALSAWCSTYRELTTDRRTRLPIFLRSLAENGHHTPFEKSYIQFLVRAEVPTQIHLLKHRIAVSVNSESARYKELRDDNAYVPPDWPSKTQARLARLIEHCQSEYHEILKELEEEGIPRKRAKESARFALPYASQYVLDVSFNFRSFVYFQGLRNSSHAQKEVRDLAASMLQQVVAHGDFRYSLLAFEKVRLPEPEWEVPTLRASSSPSTT